MTRKFVDIDIPTHIYEGVEKIAKKVGVSVDQYVEAYLWGLLAGLKWGKRVPEE